jgi:hypothetical protein
LKIGHHGSTNATPWQQPGISTKGEPAAILDAILPLAGKTNAKAVVSTFRGNYETIPRTDLLAEIGSRVSNTKNYQSAFQKAGKHFLVRTRQVTPTEVQAFETRREADEPGRPSVYHRAALFALRELSGRDAEATPTRRANVRIGAGRASASTCLSSGPSA